MIDMEALKQDVELYPDAYHYERTIRFGITASGIYSALKRLGISYKKTLQHPKANEEARYVFQTRLTVYGHAEKPIVFIDESGFAHDMPRRRGYAPIGKRCFGTQDWNARRRTNVIAALLGFCLLTVICLQVQFIQMSLSLG